MLRANIGNYIIQLKNNKPNGWGKLEEVHKKNSKPFCTNIGEFRNGTLVGQILSEGNPAFWGSFDGEWTYYDEDGLIKITDLDNNWLQ